MTPPRARPYFMISTMPLTGASRAGARKASISVAGGAGLSSTRLTFG
jgi:hypothetical protein